MLAVMCGSEAPFAHYDRVKLSPCIQMQTSHHRRSSSGAPEAPQQQHPPTFPPNQHQANTQDSHTHTTTSLPRSSVIVSPKLHAVLAVMRVTVSYTTISGTGPKPESHPPSPHHASSFGHWLCYPVPLGVNGGKRWYQAVCAAQDAAWAWSYIRLSSLPHMTQYISQKQLQNT
jgi:hypothetical protein